jgi:hypothetical protein
VHVEEGRNVCEISVGKAEEKRLFKRPRCRWDDGVWTGFV